MVPSELVMDQDAKSRGWPTWDKLQNVWACQRCGSLNYPWINRCAAGCEPMDGNQAPTVCQHDKFKPNPTLTWLGSSMDINANTHLWRCTVCDHRFDLPIASSASNDAVKTSEKP